MNMVSLEMSERVLQFLESMPPDELLQRAGELCRTGHGTAMTYSRKVFISLTQLCRDVCGYCTFAKTPKEVAKPYLSPEDVLAVARAGERAGCREALFTLGDKPELRYAAAETGGTSVR
jgi:FO synthase